MVRIRILLLGLLLFGIPRLVRAQQDFVVGPLTAQAAACPVSPGQVSQSTSALTLATVNYGGATFTIGASAFSGTVSFFGSGDGAVTWQPLNVFPSNSTTPVTTATAAGVWQVNVAAYTNVCMVATTYSSGTITATIRKATVSARAGGGGGGGAGVASLNALTGAVTLAAGTNISLTPAGNTITVADTSITGLTTGSLTKAGSATTVVNSLCDEGITTANTLTCTDTSGIAAPGFVGTGTGAGFDALVQGADNCVAKQPAGSVCWEAPAAGVTSYHGLYAVTPSTGIPHYSYSAPTITETISAIVGADCPTCIISAGAITNNVLPKGNGAQGLVNSSITDNGTNVTTTDTGGYVAPVFTANGATAGFMDFAQGTTSGAVAPCNTANSICFQAPTAVTSYLINLAGAASTGIPHYVNAANVITETITPIVVGDLPTTGTWAFGGTLSGNFSVTGNQTSTGVLTATQLDGCQHVNASQSFAAALAAVSSPGCISIDPGTYVVGTNAAIGSTVTLISESGGLLSVSTGITLTVNGQIQAPTGAQIFTGLGTVSVPTAFMSVYASWFPGADVGAKTQAAITSCPSNCRIWLPDQGTLSYSTPINMAVGASNGVHLIGAGEGATILTYTGSASNTAVSFGCTTNATLEYVQITTANTTGTGVSMCGTNNKFLNSTVNGFGTAINVTGSGASSYVRSFKTRIQNVNVSGYSSIGIQVDHAVDTYLDSIEGFGAADNTTTQDLLVDTGTSGLYVNGLSVGYGLNGLMVQKVLNNVGAPAAYNNGPLFLRFVTAFFDTIDGGDACKFDSTLGNNPVDAQFDSTSWCSAAGLNAAGTVVTTTANGVGIYGGNGITFMGKARRNANDGVLINPSAACNYIKISSAWITANNVNANAAGHGINILTGCTNVSITDSHIGNELDSGGGQKYGINVAAVNADVLLIEHNHLENNVTGTLNNGNTGNTWVWGNTPMAGPTQNIVWGGVTMTSTLGMNNNAVTGINALTPNAAGVGDIGSTALPFPNLWLGTAATNNFKFAPAATAAQRVVTLNDPGAAVSLPFLSATDTTTTHFAAATATGGVLTTRAIAATDLPAKLNGSCAPVASAVAVTSSNPTINVDQNLIQLSIPAGCLNTLSQPFEINGGGIYSSTAASSPVLTFKIKLCTISGCGSGTVVTLGSWITPALNTTAITNATYNISTTAVTSATGATGTLALKGNLTLDTGALVSTPDVVIADSNIAVSGTIDLTAALFIDFTVAQSVAGASNSYTQMLGAER